MHKTAMLIWCWPLCALTATAAAGPALTFQPAANMPTGRGGQVCGVLDGKVVVAGGTYWIDGETKVWTGDLHIYDPKTNTWSKGPDMPFPLSYGTGDAIAGRLYIVSGSDGQRDYKETIICRRVGGQYQWLWGPALPAPRIYTASVVIGTKLYVIGGAPDHELNGKFYNDMLILDTARPGQGWRSSHRMPGAGRVLLGAAAIGDRIYVFGGYQRTRDGMKNSDDAFVYDTAKDRWDRLPDAPYAARCWDGLALDGQVYLLGGYVTWPLVTGRPEGFTDKVLRFDPETKRYAQAGELLLPVVGINPRVLPDGSVFVAGGEDRKKHRTDVAAIGRLEWNGSDER